MVGLEANAQVTEDALAAALEAGEHDRAIEILVAEHGERVYQYCRRMLGSDADADDTAQTVFVQAFQGVDDLREVRSPRAWLLGIARHRCLDRLKARKRGPQACDGDQLTAILDGIAADRDVRDDPAVTRALDDCLDRLDERSRTVLILRFHDELRFPQIGALISDTPGALRVRLVRALEKLRGCLERKGIRP